MKRNKTSLFPSNLTGGSAHSEDALIPDVAVSQNNRRGRGRENTPLIGSDKQHFCFLIRVVPETNVGRSKQKREGEV